MRLQPTAKFISAMALVSAIGLSIGIGQASGAEVALVESVSGRVVADGVAVENRKTALPDRAARLPHRPIPAEL